MDLLIRPIESVDTKGLVNLEKNYLRLNKTEGGKYTLVEVRRELARRDGGKFEGKVVVERILKLSEQSNDGLITYGELFSSLYERPWIGNGSQQKVGKDLGVATLHCVQNDLPIVTTLVVPQATRSLTVQAKQNILNCAKIYGMKNTLPTAEKFTHQQQSKSLRLVNVKL